MIKTSYIICLHLILFQTAFSANGHLTGKITDRETGKPLIGALVTINPPKLNAKSNQDGIYLVSNIPGGKYTIVVSHTGYHDVSLSDILINSGETTTIDTSLLAIRVEMNPYTVSASKRREKLLESPAHVIVIDDIEIESRTVLTPSEHLKTMPALDVATTGINQSLVVVRGFNNVFSGALLSLVDYRIARVPSLRVNIYHWIPIINEDLERIEVVLGPGSALYGPNSANGVMHMFTKSPFDSEGTRISIAGGERKIFMGSYRHAGSVNKRFGYKISGQYYQGMDWLYNDPEEPEKILKSKQTSSGRIAIGDSIDNSRNFDVEKLSIDARLDFNLKDDMKFIVNGGFNKSSNLELTGIGAVQVIDWTYSYAQARFSYKDLFMQGYINFSNAGNTYVLRTGELIVDKSKLLAGQVQHGASLGNQQHFIYGLDILLTQPNTGHTINGRNENKDSINEIGVYLQSETNLNSKVKLVAASRIDHHNRLDNLVFSPRLALIYKPTTNQNLRLTFNRAFDTPSSNNLYLDILSQEDPFGLKAISPDSKIDIRVQGVPVGGFQFRRSADGRPKFRSPFASLIGLTTSDFIELDDPLFSNVMWNVGRGVVLSKFEGQLAEMVASVIPLELNSTIPNVLSILNPASTSTPFNPVNDVVEIETLKPSIKQTIEFGYKEILGNKLLITVDFYHSVFKNFIAPLNVETPNVFLDGTSLSTELRQAISTLYAVSDAVTQATLTASFDDPGRGGNGNGTPVDEITDLFATNIAKIPFGTVTPEQAFDPTAIMLTYRNFGNISLSGADFGFIYYLNPNWSFTGNYSFVSDDFFPKSDSQPHNISLNAPKNKFSASIQYENPKTRFGGELRFRKIYSFPVNSNVYIGTVDAYTILDLNLTYQLPSSNHTRLSLTIQNLTNNKHIEMIGAPEIGRLALLRINQSF